MKSFHRGTLNSLFENLSSYTQETRTDVEAFLTSDFVIHFKLNPLVVQHKTNHSSLLEEVIGLPHRQYGRSTYPFQNALLLPLACGIEEQNMTISGLFNLFNQNNPYRAPRNRLSYHGPVQFRVEARSTHKAEQNRGRRLGNLSRRPLRKLGKTVKICGFDLRI